MSKIRKYLIHLLGGATEEQCDRRIKYTVKTSWVSATEAVLFYMNTCYGMPADEWCKSVYEYTCERYEQAQIDLKGYARIEQKYWGRINDARDRDRY